MRNEMPGSEDSARLVGQLDKEYQAAVLAGDTATDYKVWFSDT